MKCTVCGAAMKPVTTDLPFKLSENHIVIVKQLPVLQCGACREYLIEDASWSGSTACSSVPTVRLSLKSSAMPPERRGATGDPPPLQSATCN
jgi:YgiT-type zinc finger domain-containing protein